MPELALARRGRSRSRAIPRYGYGYGRCKALPAMPQDRVVLYHDVHLVLLTDLPGPLNTAQPARP
jgi:hypothetical protein